MTSEQIDLIRASFAKVLHDKDAAGQLFYDRLFAIAPELRSLFKIDIETQSRKLMDTLSVAVSTLRDLPTLVPVLQDLGERHRGYGVQASHYAKVGEALIWTLDKGLGPAFDSPTRAAWTDLFGVVAKTMEPRVAA